MDGYCCIWCKAFVIHRGGHWTTAPKSTSASDAVCQQIGLRFRWSWGWWGQSNALVLYPSPRRYRSWSWLGKAFFLLSLWRNTLKYYHVCIEFNSRMRWSLAWKSVQVLSSSKWGFSKIYLYVTACLSFCLFSKKMFTCGTLLNSQIKIGVDSLTEKFSPDFDLKAELEKGLVPSPPGSPTRKKAHR